MTGSTYAPDTWQEVQSSKVKTDAKGISTSCLANQNTNIDLVLTDDELIRGIEFYATGQTFGDTVTIQVIDTNGVTGLPPGTVISTPVLNFNIDSSIQSVLCYQSVVPQKALATMTIRLIYTSTALVGTIKVGINYLFLKPTI